MVITQSVQDIKDYVTRSLGEGVVAVEMTDLQLQDSVDSASMLYHQIIGAYQFTTIDIIGGTGEYSMPNDCISIAEVYFDMSRSGIYESFDWAGVELGPMSFGMYGGHRDSSGAGGGYSYLIQSLNYRDQSKRILSVDEDWFWDRERKLLCLTPKNSSASKIGVKYQSNDIDWSRLYPHEYHLFRRFALAESMITLGQIRTKYSTLPSAQGDLSLNGDALKSEADGIKMNLMEHIKAIRPPLPITT
tara:strand:- start:552 stop:1289 length:738 start_codon:yes stop_codon:yes gene_type:complete